jgi:hypothetical protein
MSDARLTLRNHDSEWLLQRERVFNDHQVQKARRDTRTRGRHRNPAMYLGLPDPDPADQAKAARVVEELAAGVGAGPGELDDVLHMLGLAPEPVVPVAEKTPPARPHGQCRTCLRYAIPLRVNGDLIVHPDHPDKTAAESRCNGSNTRPIKREAAA